MEDSTSFRLELDREFDFHTDPVLVAQPAARFDRYSDSLADYSLDDGGHMEPLPLGCPCPDPVFHLGIYRYRVAACNHFLELGTVNQIGVFQHDGTARTGRVARAHP